jgi:hypothetical protein
VRDTFTDEETIIIFESARIALSDGGIFDLLAEDMDLNDEFLRKIRTKLEGYMKNKGAN